MRFTSNSRIRGRSTEKRKPSEPLSPEVRLFNALRDLEASSSKIQELISVCTDLNKPDFSLKTHMHLAAIWRGRPKEIRALYIAGASLYSKDGSGKTPIERAQQVNNFAAIRELRRLELQSQEEPILKSA